LESDRPNSNDFDLRQEIFVRLGYSLLDGSQSSSNRWPMQQGRFRPRVVRPQPLILI
jgi:hypothetical protein